MFIYEEIVAGGGDMTYAELVQFGRHFRCRLRIAALRAAMLTPVLWAGIFLLSYSALVGSWEAFNWRGIIGFWDESKWREIVGLWAVITLLGVVPNRFWDMLRHP